MMLREYQQRAINDLFYWLKTNEGNPCVVMPTGSGKSHVIAELTKNLIEKDASTRILMVTHVKELIAQNAAKMRALWPNAPMGICSAGLGKHELDEPITFAGIQSVAKKIERLGKIDFIIIDECHLVNHNAEGSYRKLIRELTATTPSLRVIGFSATPYRLGHGLITTKPAIFDDLIESVSIEELVQKKYLAPLRSKVTSQELSVIGVHKRGGEFIESELQKAVDTNENNRKVVSEVIALAGDRRAWLFFCAGVEHAKHINDLLNASGIVSACITGDTPKAERDRTLNNYKAGKTRALTNANVLTTGFDYPDIDLIAMLRPTMSPGLYVQMAGRGMRQKQHTDHCLVLDFAGVVKMHGPITGVSAPEKTHGDGTGEAPVKVCEHCNELVHLSAIICPACQTPFPESVKTPLRLHQEDIMGNEQHLPVSSWTWRVHESRTNGKIMLSVAYYSDFITKPVTEYLPVLHDGYARTKAVQLLYNISQKAGASLVHVAKLDGVDALNEIVHTMNEATPPASISYVREGKFYKVKGRQWKQE